MKATINKLIIALLALLPVISSCSREEMSYSNNGVSAVQLVAPCGDWDMKLFNNETAATEFTWTGSPGGEPYQLTFYDSGKKELSRIPLADSITTYYVSHRTFNALAIKGGIAPAGSGVMYWGVITTKGLLETVSELRKLDVTSYRAFNDFPVSLYITGPGTEGGADVTEAPRFRETGEGQYEIYTELKADEGFYFTNKNTPGGGQTYTVQDEYIVTGNDVPVTVTTAGIYRIRLDFISAKMTAATVSDVNYYTTNNGSSFQTFAMEYAGYGKWTYSLTFPATITANTNDQYKFVASIGGTNRSLGASSAQGSAPLALDGPYFYVAENSYSTSNATNRRNYTYRYMTELNDQDAMLILDMSSEQPSYNHVIDVGDLTVYPVTELLTPADGAPVALDKTPSAQSFTWTPSAGPDPRPKPKYDITFFKDAEGTQPLLDGAVFAADGDRFTASGSVSYANLEAIAADAGIPLEGTGDVWWSVVTTVMNKSGLSDQLRRLSITRIQGIPEDCYITGDGTEFGAALTGAKKLKRTASGEFEIYTRLTRADGTFNFVNRTSGSPNTWTVTGLTMSGGKGTGTLEMNTTPTETPEDGAYVYRIKANFNTDQISFERINDVRWYSAGSGGTSSAMTYNGNGVWSVTWTYPNTENRYYFRTVVGTASYSNNAYTERWSSWKQNVDPAPTEETWLLDPDIFSQITILTRAQTTNQWDYSFKFIQGKEYQNRPVKATIYMSPELDNYYHEITY